MLVLDEYLALGTRFWVEIYDEGINVEVIASTMIGCIEEFEKKYSRFNDASFLNMYTLEDLLKDEEVGDILEKSFVFMRESDGVFNIFIKDKLEEKGYGIKHNINKNNIDLGGIGKGYLIDKLASILKVKFNLKYFLINGGGDMYMTSDHEMPIDIYMQHPVNDDEYIYKISLKDQGFAASSSFKRKWIKSDNDKPNDDRSGDIVNHFISPLGDEVWAASYVIATNAMAADVYATVLCIDPDLALIKSKGYSNTIEYFIIKDDEIYKSYGFDSFIKDDSFTKDKYNI